LSFEGDTIMPFDGSNRQPSNLLAIVRTARTRIRRRWVKNSLSKPRSDVNPWTGFCLLGSIRCNDNGNEMPITPDHQMALRLLREAVAHRTPDPSAGSAASWANDSIVSMWNDQSYTTHAAVCEVMDEVVRQQEIVEGFVEA